MLSSWGDWVYVVTDIESDGEVPGRNSMLAFASVAVLMDGTRFGEFEAVLERLPEAAPSEDTMAWWGTQPEAYAAATTNPEPPSVVMPRFAQWVRSLPGRRAFAASPLAFDASWMDHYLRRFVGDGIVPSLYESAPLFTAPGLCIRSFASAVTRRPIAELTSDVFPAEWLGDIEHTHRAIDDARGYAALLVSLARQVA